MDDLRLPEGWRETRFDAEGVSFVREDGSPTVDVVAGDFEREAGTERFVGDTDTGPFESERTRLDERPDIPETDTFGVLAGFDGDRSLFAVAPDRDDALAAAVWLASVADTERAMRRATGLHEGAAVPGFRAVVPDNDAVEAALADGPERCVFTGKPTRSHELTLPYRYAPALDGCPRTPLGAPRTPVVVTSLVGAVSHTAWEDRDLATIDFDAPLERTESGVYRYDADVVSALEGAEFGRFARREPGPQG